MKYLYEGHMGNLYTTDDELDFDKLYCEQCGDSDWPIGSFETVKDFWKLVKDKCAIGNRGGFSLQYIYPFIVYEFNLPDNATYENEYYKEEGFCNNTDKEILEMISKLIKGE